MSTCTHDTSHRLDYLERGQGKTVIFIHGNAGDGRAWYPQLDALSHDHRAIAVHLRYFGTSPWPDSGDNFSPQVHIDDLHTFIQQLGTDPVTLVGWSYGGALALELAVNHPQWVRRLFLYEPSLGSAVSDPELLAAMGEDRKSMFAPAVAALQSGDMLQAMQCVVDGLNAAPGTFESLPDATRNILLDNARVLARVFVAPPLPPVSCAQLGQIKVPVTVAYGAETRPFFRIIAQTVASCVPGCTSVTIPQGRHMWPMQNPTAFTQALQSFLAD